MPAGDARPFDAALAAAERALGVGDAAEALALSAAVLRQWPRNVRARRTHLQAALTAGDEAEAEADLAVTASRAPDALPHLLDQAVGAAARAGRLSFALAAIMRYRDAHPDVERALRLLVDLGGRDHHAVAFRQAIASLLPGERARGLEGLLALRRDDLGAAERWLEALRHGDPSRPPLLLAFFKRAEVTYDHPGRFRFGRELVAQAGAAASLEVIVQTMKSAAVLGEMGESRCALAILREAIAATEDDPARFARKWRSLLSARCELLELEAAVDTLARARAAGLATETESEEEGLFRTTFTAELARARQVLHALMEGRAPDLPEREVVRITSPDQKFLNTGDPRQATARRAWLAVVGETLAQARARGGMALIVPEWLADAAARVRPAPRILSYHTTGERPGTAHFKEADLVGHVSIDRLGYAGWSSFAAMSLEEVIRDVPTDRAVEAHRARLDAALRANESKYAQPERGGGPALPGDYVLFALQVLTDRVQVLARVPMLEALDIVADRFAGTGTAVVAKRHPMCRDDRVAEHLDDLVARGRIILRHDSIHDLIGGAQAVVTVNSAVGLEALLHAKPVYLFGEAEYGAAAHRVADAASFRILTDPIRMPVPAEALSRFLLAHRERYLVDTRDPARLAAAIRDRVFGAADSGEASRDLPA